MHNSSGYNTHICPSLKQLLALISPDAGFHMVALTSGGTVFRTSKQNNLLKRGVPPDRHSPWYIKLINVCKLKILGYFVQKFQCFSGVLFTSQVNTVHDASIYLFRIRRISTSWFVVLFHFRWFLWNLLNWFFRWFVLYLLHFYWWLWICWTFL